MSETIEEFEINKEYLINDRRAGRLGISNWKALNSYPPTDIIWNEV